MARVEDEMDKVFTYHPPDDDQVGRYKRIREAAKEFATVIVECAPSCADRSAALRHVRDAVMNTNASIALNGLI